MILLSALPLMGVTPVMVSGDLVRPARHFDLEGRTLRFTPSGEAYVIDNAPLSALRPRGAALGNAAFASGRSNGWRVAIPFAFPFGGRMYREMFVNQAGNITFDRPEAQIYPERDTWAGGTMRQVHGSLTGRSMAGTERMIAAFWGLNSGTSPVFVQSSASELSVTWQAERYKTPNEGYGSLGPNLFQATIFPTGAIELSYERVSEMDGIAGIFTGRPPLGRRIDLLADQPGDSPDPRIEVISVEAFDAGDSLRFSFVTARDIPQAAPEGTLWYRVFLRRSGWNCEIGLWVDTRARGYSGLDCGGSGVSMRVEGTRLDLYVSKEILSPGTGLRWNADILWAPRPGTTLRDDAGTRDLPLAGVSFEPFDFTSAAGSRDGAIAEVFHYPSVSKNVAPSMRYIYRLYEPLEELALVLFDFRIDDLHNHQGIATPINTGIAGIGPGYAMPGNGLQTFGSPRLAGATGPMYLGQRFAEFVEDNARKYKNWAFGVGWVAHEFTHRWGAALQIRHPQLTDPRALLDTACFCHWNQALDTRSMTSVWSRFSDSQYPERSTMDGGFFDEQADGTFRRRNVPYLTPFGFSPLDLYMLGLIPPSEVPPTFLIQNMQTAGNVIRGTKQTIQISEVIAGSGERVPNSQNSPKEVTIAFYLMHENGRGPDAAKLAQAQGIDDNLVEWFRLATAGRARMTPVTARLRVNAAAVKLISGGDQSGAPGETLAEPLVIEVADAQGFPLPGIAASLESGNATVAAGITTDAIGRASVPVQLGDMPGEASVTVRVEGAEPLVVKFQVNPPPELAARTK